MPKPSKQIHIDFIISCLKNGEQRGNILVKVGKKWGTSKSAFDRYLKIAKEQYSITQGLIKKELLEIDKAAAIEARKKAIMTADERKELLTKFINGEIKAKIPFVIAGKIMEYPSEPSHSDRLKAIAELNKMEGDYQPNKLEISGEVGVQLFKFGDSDDTESDN